MNDFASYGKGKNEIAIAFRSDFIVTYIENLEQLHNFRSSKKGFKALAQIAAQPLIINSKKAFGQ